MTRIGHGSCAVPIVGGMHIPFSIPECRIDSVLDQNPNRLTIRVPRDGQIGRCPDCGYPSRSVHSRYHRNRKRNAETEQLTVGGCTPLSA